MGVILLSGISATESQLQGVQHDSQLYEQHVLLHPPRQASLSPSHNSIQSSSLNPSQKHNLKHHVQIHHHKQQQQNPQPQPHHQIHHNPQHNLLQHSKQTPQQNNPQRNSESIKFIGPHNLPDHYFDLRWMVKSTNKSILDAIKVTYNIRPILRDLDLSRMDDKEIFTVVMKREIAWSHPESNEFGLMLCEDLKFRNSPFAGYIELIPDGRRISIQKFDDSISYQRVSQASKDLQSRCLIKTLEKTPSPVSTQPPNCKTQIPFCFSDSWRQIWWKVIE